MNVNEAITSVYENLASEAKENILSLADECDVEGDEALILRGVLAKLTVSRILAERDRAISEAQGVSENLSNPVREAETRISLNSAVSEDSSSDNLDGETPKRRGRKKKTDET